MTAIITYILVSSKFEKDYKRQFVYKTAGARNYLFGLHKTQM